VYALYRYACGLTAYQISQSCSTDLLATAIKALVTVRCTRHRAVTLYHAKGLLRQKFYIFRVSTTIHRFRVVELVLLSTLRQLRPRVLIVSADIISSYIRPGVAFSGKVFISGSVNIGQVVQKLNWRYTDSTAIL
jgi:hypothetical protein